MTELKTKALMNFWDCDEFDAEQMIEDEKFLVLTDEEAQEKCKEMIELSLWAFNADFLASFTGLPTEIFVALQENNKCEDNNETILKLIDDLDELVEAAIAYDTRGHFISHYDGKENEIDVEGETFYIYRLD